MEQHVSALLIRHRQAKHVFFWGRPINNVARSSCINHLHTQLCRLVLRNY